MKAVIPREQARHDVSDIVDHYSREAGIKITFNFIHELQAAFALIGEHPASGSSRYAHELNLPDLRSIRLSRYPYLIFYAEQADHIDVWRVLHAKRDIPAWLDEASPAGDIDQKQ